MHITMPRNGTAVDKTKDEKDRQKIINPKKELQRALFWRANKQNFSTPPSPIPPRLIFPAGG